MKEGPCTETYEVVDTDYPTKTVYVTREVYEPAAPAYYTVIPNAHCSKGSASRYLTAPVHANPDGSPLQLPEIHTSKDIETARIKGDTVTVYADLAIKEGLSYEQYLQAIAELQEIESGTHHVSTGLISATASAATQETFFMEKTDVDQPGGPSKPLVVDIEKSLRATPINPVTGKPFPAPDSKEGFVPLGGDSGTAPTGSLGDGDGTRFNEARNVALNDTWKKTNPDPLKPAPANPTRDQINKFWTPADASAGFTKNNVDRAAVSNDTVLFHPTGDSATPKDSEVVPRTFSAP